LGELGAVFVFVFCFLVFWLRALTIVQWQWSPHSVPVDRCCTVGPLLRDGSTWALLFVFRVVLVRGGVVVLAALTCWVLVGGFVCVDFHGCSSFGLCEMEDVETLGH